MSGQVIFNRGSQPNFEQLTEDPNALTVCNKVNGESDTDYSRLYLGNDLIGVGHVFSDNTDGLVPGPVPPSPSITNYEKSHFLREDGTWSVPTGVVYVAECQTSASTAPKVANLQSYGTVNPDISLSDGLLVCVKFRYSNTATNPTLNLDSTGAHAIYNSYTKPVGTTPDTSWSENDYVLMVYSTFSSGRWVIVSRSQNQPDWHQTTVTNPAYINNKPPVDMGKSSGSYVTSSIVENGVPSQGNVGTYSHTEGYSSIASGSKSHSEGDGTTAQGIASHSEGSYTVSFADYSHSEGDSSYAIGAASHSEGRFTTSYGDHSHAEGAGDYTGTVSGVTGSGTSYTMSSASPLIRVGAVVTLDNLYGAVTSVSGNNFTLSNTIGTFSSAKTVSICEGISFAEDSHSEGKFTTASGLSSHAEGNLTLSGGDNSHAEGYGTVALNSSEHAEGKYNVSNTGNTSDEKTISSIGVGTADNARKNAVDVRLNGDVYIDRIGNYNGTGNAEPLQDVISGIQNDITSVSGDIKTYTIEEYTSSHQTGVGKQYNLVDSDGDTCGDTITIPSNPDWKEDISSGLDYIKNRPNLREGEDDGIIEGNISDNVSEGEYAHAEGDATFAIGDNSHTEGNLTIAQGDNAHAEGLGVHDTLGLTGSDVIYTVDGDVPNGIIGTMLLYQGTIATVLFADRSQITLDTTFGTFGKVTDVTWLKSGAIGNNSHVEGEGTITLNSNEHAQGQYNVSNTGKLNTIHSIGIGVDDAHRRNAVEVLKDGNVYVYGVGDYNGEDPGRAASLQSLIGGIIASIHQYTIESTTPDTGYLTAYQLKQDGSFVGAKINIPKDFLVKSGDVIDVVEYNGEYYDATDTEHENPLPVSQAGKYLDFVVNVQSGTATDEHIYILVSDLVDVYTGGNGVTINSSNVVSLDLTANGGLQFSGSTEGSKTVGLKLDSSNSNGLSIGSGGLSLATVTASTNGSGGSNGAMLATDKEKLDGIATGAEVNVQSDWNQTNNAADDFIKNKPYLAKSVTYLELKNLRDDGELSPGSWYRITDYFCEISGTNEYTSNENRFDILVLADSATELNENAFATQHAGDPYFQNSDLSSWELKYCLDNDRHRFNWANSGIFIDDIESMKPDWEELPQEVIGFLNDYERISRIDYVNGAEIGFWLNGTYSGDVVYGFSKDSGESISQDLTIHVAENDYYSSIDKGTMYLTISGETNSWQVVIGDINEDYVPVGTGVVYWMRDEWGNEAPYDFKNIMFKRYKITACERVPDLVDQYSIGGLPGVTVGSTWYWCYTFCILDISNNYTAHDTSVYWKFAENGDGYYSHTSNNTISKLFKTVEDFGVEYFEANVLPNIVFVTDTNIADQDFYGFIDNHLGENCFDITIGNNSMYNSFLGGFMESTFGLALYGNRFGYGSTRIVFGNNCTRNTFGNTCLNLYIGNSFEMNNVGNAVHGITFGNNCTRNTIYNYCGESSFGNYITNLTVFEGVNYCNVTGGNSSSTIKNAQILNGTSGTGNSDRLTISFDAGCDYTQLAALRADPTGQLTPQQRLVIWDATDSPISTKYWANMQLSSSLTYNTEPEFKQVKINGSSTNAASTNNCTIQYDATNRCVKFVFA